MTSLNILIVDDHRLQAQVLKNKLINIGGTNITCVYSGREALSKVKNDSFDVIFCDLNMPEMDGVQLLSSIKNCGYNRSIVILSALEKDIISTVGNICKKLDFSFIETMEKPASVSKLFQVIDRIKKSNIIDASAVKFNNKLPLSITTDDVLLGLSQGEFKNYYQPQIDFKSGKTVSVEVLARWLHPIYGILTPNVFLPIIESEGLIDELFEVILMNTLRDYSKKCLAIHHQSM